MGPTLIGKQAPSLSLTNYNGDKYDFKPGQGFPTALFFYPKAGSYGCTRQVCQFRDALATREDFKNTRLQVVGISSDPVEKQARFVEKQNLTYPVLSDSEDEARKAYVVGKGLLGLVNARVTFLIDSDGTVRDVLDATMNYSAHAKFVAKWLASLPKEETAFAEEKVPPSPPEEAEPIAISTSEETASVEPVSMEGAETEESSLDIPRVSEHPPQL